MYKSDKVSNEENFIWIQTNLYTIRILSHNGENNMQTLLSEEPTVLKTSYSFSEKKKRMIDFFQNRLVERYHIATESME